MTDVATPPTAVYIPREDEFVIAPTSTIDDLILEIDTAFANLQKWDKMGDYVKYDAVADLILDIRQKAVNLN